MDNLYTLTKQEPISNTIEVVFDFTDDLPSGVTISTKATAAEDSDGTDVDSTLVSSSVLSSPKVTVVITTLTSDEVYLVTVTATGSDSKTYKQNLLLSVHTPSVMS